MIDFGTAVSDAVDQASAQVTDNVAVLLIIPGLFLAWRVIKRVIRSAA